MVKDKETTKDSEKDKPVLTEWQKRNQEFLKKKEQDKAEQEEAEKRLQELRRSQFLGDKSEDDEKASNPKKVKKSKKKTKKEPKPKKVKEKNPHRNHFVVVMSLSVVILLFSAFMISPLSTSKKITVSGQHFTDEATIQQASGIKVDDYLFSVFINRDQIEKSIVKNDPWVKSAKLDFELPNHFKIKVKENRIIAYRQQEESYFPILSNGLVVDEVAQDLPNHFLSVNLDTEKDVKEFIKARQSLKKTIRRNIKSVSKESSKSTKDLIRISMYDGNTVLIPLSKLKERLPYYNQVASKMVATPGTIDMEVGIYVAVEDVSSPEVAEENSTPSPVPNDGSSEEAPQGEDFPQEVTNSQDTETELPAQ